MVTINRYIKALLHPAGGHQGSHKAHQAGNLWYLPNYLPIPQCRLTNRCWWKGHSWTDTFECLVNVAIYPNKFVSFILSRDSALLWRHNGCDGVSNHQPHDCLLNRLFRRRAKKTSKLRVTGLCVGNSPVTGEFPAQMASNAENVSIWWRHHDSSCLW